MTFFDNIGLGLSAALDGLYPDGFLHRVTETYSSDGGVTVVDTDIPIKAKVDSATEAMKTDSGYSSTDVAIMVLRTDLALNITADDKITAEGARYRIGGPIRKDTAGSHFILRGMTGA